MTELSSRFRFATAPVSWGVADYYGPSWDQPYESILDEIAACGYTGTELGPYGYFPTDPDLLRPVLERKNLKMVSSFVPVNLSDPGAATAVIERIRRVGTLLAALEAPCIVLADEQSPGRERVAGRVPADGSKGLSADQWRNVASVVDEAVRVASDFGLDLVFHPHVATFVETPREVEQFFDVAGRSNIGLCLDTGHCYYGGGDPVREAEKYKGFLRYLHIKDVDRSKLDECNRREFDFNQAVEAGVFTQIGEGNIDFPAFFRCSARNGYSGWCVVEQDITFGVSRVSSKTSMSASLKYLQKTIGLVAQTPIQIAPSPS